MNRLPFTKEELLEKIGFMLGLGLYTRKRMAKMLKIKPKDFQKMLEYYGIMISELVNAYKDKRIIEFAMKGLTDYQIARRLKMRETTVKDRMRYLPKQAMQRIVDQRRIKEAREKTQSLQILAIAKQGIKMGKSFRQIERDNSLMPGAVKKITDFHNVDIEKLRREGLIEEIRKAPVLGSGTVGKIMRKWVGKATPKKYIRQQLALEFKKRKGRFK